MKRGRPPKQKTKEELEKIEFKSQVRSIILRLLSHVESKKINWIIQSAIVKSWIKNYPDFKFWNQFELPDFLSKVNGLQPLTGEWGKEYINKQWNLYLFNNKNQSAEVKLENKIGPDIKINIKKPSNLKEFLK